jgi:DNA-binding PadR family transcriptional regulator
MLHAGPNHGYGIAAGLGELGMEDYAVDPSVIYRVLYSLEEQGMLSSTRDAEESAGPPRRVYELTRAGDAYLRAWVDDLHETERMLRAFLDVYDRVHDEGTPAETGDIGLSGSGVEGEEQE